jgi:hypothetical protein
MLKNTYKDGFSYLHCFVTWTRIYLAKVFPLCPPLMALTTFISKRSLDLSNTKKYRNFNLLSIGYANSPLLRTDLPDPD